MLRSARIATVAAALLSATPAMASDFSGLIYIFGAAFAVTGLVIFAVLFVVRRAIGSPSPIVDAVSAVALGLTFAPATWANMYGEWTFILWPVGFIAVFGDTWTSLFPGPAISVVVTSALFYLFLKRRRQTENGNHDGEPE